MKEMEDMKNMKYTIQNVETDTELIDVSKLAREIWTEHYTSLIGSAQTEYMISNFQSADRIKKDISEKGYSYFAVYDEKIPIGYFALQPDEKGVFISKIYVLKEYRQRGIATKIIQFSLDFAKEAARSEKSVFDAASHEKPCMWLTVNKGNLGSIEFYKKAGFEISEEIVTDIGNGFVMDDYVMTAYFETE
jgi:Acetyltransferases